MTDGGLRDLAALQSSLRSVCFDRSASEADLARLGGERDRWLMYRAMVRLRLNRLFEQALPRSFERVGAPVLNPLLDDYYATGRPWTRYFWVLPMEFVDFVEAHDAASALNAWQLDLLRFEAARWEVSDRQASDAGAQPFVFDAPVHLLGALRVLELRFPVHNAEFEGSSAAPGSVYVAVYRGSDFKVHTLELNATAYGLLTRWQACPQESAAQALRVLATQQGWSVDEAFLNGLASWLADMCERGVIVGSRAPAVLA